MRFSVTTVNLKFNAGHSSGACSYSEFRVRFWNDIIVRIIPFKRMSEYPAWYPDSLLYNRCLTSCATLDQRQCGPIINPKLDEDILHLFFKNNTLRKIVPVRPMFIKTSKYLNFYLENRLDA